MLRALTACGLVLMTIAFGACQLDFENQCEHCDEGRSCRGSVPGQCSVGDPCNHWWPGEDCSVLGATCEAGDCIWTEACPGGVDSFCRAGHVLYCTGGSITGAWSCGTPFQCRAVVDADGLGHAVCALPNDACSFSDARGSECRDATHSVGCEYGLVTAKAECQGTTCTPVTTSSGTHAVVCAKAGGEGCSNAEAASMTECRGNSLVSCEYGLFTGTRDCGANDVCITDTPERARCTPR